MFSSTEKRPLIVRMNKADMASTTDRHGIFFIVKVTKHAHREIERERETYRQRKIERKREKEREINILIMFQIIHSTASFLCLHI